MRAVAMGIIRCLFALVALAAGTAYGRAAEPLIRASILTPQPIVAGQQVELQVDVLVPNFFLSPPQYPLFDLPGAIVTLPDTRSMNLVETIDGESFAGIRRSYVITPQAAGDFVLPPAAITFAYAAVPGQSTNGTVTLPAVKFSVAGAPGGAAGPVATATKVTVTQTLDRDPASLKAGDTLVRTVTVIAEGMQAMMIPVPVFEAPEGVRVYPHDPVLSDRTAIGQGSIGGKRVDRVTYAFEKPGSYRLPSVEIGWYDPAARGNDTAEAPAVTVSVADNKAFEPAIAPPVAEKDAASAEGNAWLRALSWAVAGLAALGILTVLAMRTWPKLRAGREARRKAEEQSEAAFFRRFEEVSRSGDVRSIYSALDAWTRRAGIAPLTAWLSAAGDGATGAEVQRLQSAVFAERRAAGTYDTRKLVAGLSRARRLWLAGRKSGLGMNAALPPLNP